MPGPAAPGSLGRRRAAPEDSATPYRAARVSGLRGTLRKRPRVLRGDADLAGRRPLTRGRYTLIATAEGESGKPARAVARFRVR